MKKSFSFTIIRTLFVAGNLVCPSSLATQAPGIARPIFVESWDERVVTPKNGGLHGPRNYGLEKVFEDG